MFFVTYLNDADRFRLAEVQEILPLTMMPDERKKLLAEQQAIEARRKPLHECNMEECIELRQQIYHKYEKIVQTGKHGIEIQFKRMIAVVEQRIQILTIEAGSVEMDKKKKLRKEQIARAKERKEQAESGAIKTRTGFSRWTMSTPKSD
jgi:hypothetical protein